MPRLRTLFGVGRRPHRKVGADLSPRQAVVIERPRWNLTLFKVHFGLLTLKGYTKGEHVLRFEAIVHNTKTLHTGRVLEKFPTIVARLAGMVDRFTSMLDCVDVAFLPDGILDQLPTPSQIGATRTGGLDNKQAPHPRSAGRRARPSRLTRRVHRRRPRDQSPHAHRPEQGRLHRPASRLRPAQTARQTPRRQTRPDPPLPRPRAGRPLSPESGSTRRRRRPRSFSWQARSFVQELRKRSLGVEEALVRIAVLATGGTIASRRDHRGHLVISDDLDRLTGLAALPEGAEIVGTALSAKPSFALGPTDMLALAREVRTRLMSFEGVVITHGTDTMEETAYLLGQCLPGDARVVLTGAQRGADEADSDGRRNLADALSAVCALAPLGPAVVVGGVAVAAVEARKVHTSSLLAFSGGDAGILAIVDADGIHRVSTSARGAYYAACALPNSLPRVDLVKLVAGSDGLHVRASVGAGALGVVVETFGSGNATEAVLEAVRDATSRGVVVVVTSRTGSGRVRALYGDNGGGVDLVEAGGVFASDLTGPRARIALALALSLEPFADVGLAVQSMAEGKSPCKL